MTAVSSFWQMVVLPTLGFCAMVGWAELSGKPLTQPAQFEALSSAASDWDWDSVSWSDLLPETSDTARESPPRPRQSAPERFPLRQHDVAWPMR
ncbi:MAG: hypothetical protein AB7O62_06140 [Pirellulales bacterium]